MTAGRSMFADVTESLVNPAGHTPVRALGTVNAFALVPFQTLLHPQPTGAVPNALRKDLGR